LGNGVGSVFISFVDVNGSIIEDFITSYYIKDACSLGSMKEKSCYKNAFSSSKSRVSRTSGPETYKEKQMPNFNDGRRNSERDWNFKYFTNRFYMIL